MLATLALVGCTSAASGEHAAAEQRESSEPKRLADACRDCGHLADAEVDDASEDEHEDAVMPGPNHGGARAAARLDAEDECRNCHGSIAREWAASGHASAYVDPMFTAAFARESESPFCQGCHAPEADPRARPSERAAAIGVGCVSCHLDADGRTVLAAGGPGRDDSARAPHPLRREVAFAGPQACASCHEFGFPDARADPDLLMQRTISEHQASADPDVACQRCHMPDGSHRVDVDDALLRSAASISATRGPDALVVQIEPRALGHAFPTGDLFRRLAVVVTSEDGSWSEQRFLARRFDLVRGPAGAPMKVETADERVGVRPGPTEVAFTLPPELAGQTLRWSVAWQRVLETPIGASADAEVWSARELASGRAVSASDPAASASARAR